MIYRYRSPSQMFHRSQKYHCSLIKCKIQLSLSRVNDAIYVQADNKTKCNYSKKTASYWKHIYVKRPPRKQNIFYHLILTCPPVEKPNTALFSHPRLSILCVIPPVHRILSELHEIASDPGIRGNTSGYRIFSLGCHTFHMVYELQIYFQVLILVVFL